MNIDENLMAKPAKESKDENESSERAGDFRQNAGASRLQKSGAGSDNSADSEDDSNFSQSALSIREAAMAKKKTSNEVTQEEDPGSAAAKAVNQGTSEMLKQSWLNLIPSWGTSLIWINIHVFLRQILGPKLFCKLGDEWAPGGTSGSVISEARRSSVNASDTADSDGSKWTSGQGRKSSFNNVGESAGLAGCDGCCLFVVLIIMTIIVIIYKALSEPDTAISLLGAGLWDLIKSLF